MTTLKIKLNTAHCNVCQRITGRDDKGNCIICVRRMANELKGRKILWEGELNADSK